MGRPNSSETGRWLRPIGLLTAIPFVLLVGPLIGYYLGDWLDRRYGTEPWLMVIFIVLGFTASGREVYKLIKSAARDTNGN
ncbi:MAG TPA: AtpZ/AtpI family protein [candidate division Zixibacteria bacterium]|jgi:F0F1-type ATP synthase assembly protein I